MTTAIELANQRDLGWLLVRTVRTANGCWEYQGKRSSLGYGRVYVRGSGRRNQREEFAHRLVARIVFGACPSGKVVAHSCDNPPCINPAHLRYATKRENTRDGWSRGRMYSPFGRRERTRTHCTNGHPYSGDNLYVTPRGYRRCRACHRKPYRSAA